VVKEMIKRRKWIRGLFGFLTILIILGGVSIVFIRTLCGDSIPDTMLNESITSFMGDASYTTHDLILAAEQYISNRVWFVARAGSSTWTSAIYQCNRQNCQLQRLHHEVGTKRYITCSRRMPGNEKVTQFRFDIMSDHIQAETFSAEGGIMLSPRQLREVSPTIDESLTMIFDRIDPAFLESYTTIVVNLSAHMGHWQVSIQDLTESEQITIQVPFNFNSSGG
jgi:hypothetical protein